MPQAHDDAPAQPPKLDRKELRRRMGDTNNDGVLSAEEIFTVLENGKPDLADEFLQQLIGEDLRGYRKLLSQMPTAEKRREFHASLKSAFEEQNHEVLKAYKQSPPDTPERQLVQSLDEIEIPDDLLRLEAAFEALPAMHPGGMPTSGNVLAKPSALRRT
jgi:hypothetical protein